MVDFLKGPVETFQEFLFLSGRAFRNIVRSPHYSDDILLQMDAIGVGSLFIVSLIGFFSGVVMALQMSRALATYGAQGQTQTQKRTTAPQDVPSPSQQVVSELTKDNLDRVAASPAQLKAVLAKDTGLLVELKRWIAKDASKGVTPASTRSVIGTWPVRYRTSGSLGPV